MKRNDAGYTLAEVIISMLLAAIMISAVFHLTLTSLQSGNRIDRKTAASEAQRHLSEQLAQYVSGDCTTSTIAGPLGMGAAGWRINGATGEDGRTVTDSCGACYALSGGVHNLSKYLPVWFESKPFFGTISYTVTVAGGTTTVAMANCTGSTSLPRIDVNVTWSEP